MRATLQEAVDSSPLRPLENVSVGMWFAELSLL